MDSWSGCASNSSDRTKAFIRGARALRMIGALHLEATLSERERRPSLYSWNTNTPPLGTLTQLEQRAGAVLDENGI